MKNLSTLIICLFTILFSILQTNAQTRSLRHAETICYDILRVPHSVYHDDFVDNYNKTHKLKKDNKYIFLSKETTYQFGMRYEWYYLIPIRLYGNVQYKILKDGEVSCENYDYENLTQTNSINDVIELKNFIVEYPSSSKNSEIQERIDNIENEEKSRRDAIRWEEWSIIRPLSQSQDIKFYTRTESNNPNVIYAKSGFYTTEDGSDIKYVKTEYGNFKSEWKSNTGRWHAIYISFESQDKINLSDTYTTWARMTDTDKGIRVKSSNYRQLVKDNIPAESNAPTLGELVGGTLNAVGKVMNGGRSSSSSSDDEGSSSSSSSSSSECYKLTELDHDKIPEFRFNEQSYKPKNQVYKLKCSNSLRNPTIYTLYVFFLDYDVERKGLYGDSAKEKGWYYFTNDYRDMHGPYGTSRKAAEASCDCD